MTDSDFILQHRNEDVRRLALAKAPDGIDLRWCLQQIEGWQLAQRKLPRWAATEGLWFPPRLSFEQCSSEQTAEYKRSIAERLLPSEERISMADLTGGLGVDFSYLAPLFRHATYVEILPHLVVLARHNMPLLLRHEGLEIQEASTATTLLEATRLVFLDPARRDVNGRRTYSIADCTPNFIELQDRLLASSLWVMVKFSPMLDIQQALKQLHCVHEIHVVSLHGECKELLFVLSAQAVPTSPTIHCVNLGANEDTIIVKSEDTHHLLLASHLSSLASDTTSFFLYEPNASILKAGIQDVLCERYDVRKLHPMSNLFVADKLIDRFPGRRFRVTGISDFSKRNLRQLIGDLRQANLTIRNFPTSVDALRRQLHLSEGGNIYLFATTLSNGQHALIRCEK